MSHETLFKLAYWSTWAAEVEKAGQNFAASPIFVDQGQPVEEFQTVADKVFAQAFVIDHPEGMLRDEQFGARVVPTTHGPLTRMWLDSNVEWDFLWRNLPLHDLNDGIRVLDIGAGYGRLAVSMADHVARYVCVDAVPISTQLCREYCRSFAPKVEVPSLPDFLAIYRASYTDINLAINIHSFNECTREQIAAWLDLLGEISVPYLFTVSHGQNDASVEKSYYAWEEGRPSWRPLIEERYELIVEEALGFTNHPHAIWSRR